MENEIAMDHCSDLLHHAYTEVYALFNQVVNAQTRHARHEFLLGKGVNANAWATSIINTLSGEDPSCVFMDVTMYGGTEPSYSNKLWPYNLKYMMQ